MGTDMVHKYVGYESSGHSFDAVKLNSDGRPHNPLINAGGIMVCSLANSHLSQAQRFSSTLDLWTKLAGGKSIHYDNSIYLSSKESSHISKALAYLMKSKKAFPEGTDVDQTLEYYLQTCAMQMDTDTLAVVAATLANGGICPMTGDRILKSETV